VHYQALTLAKLKISSYHKGIGRVISRGLVSAASSRLSEFLEASGFLRLSSFGSDFAHVFYQPPRQSLACPEAVVLIRFEPWLITEVRLLVTEYGTQEQLDLIHDLIHTHIEDHKLTVYRE
jgi:hypothetical protein